MAPNFEFVHWWRKENRRGNSVVLKMENPNYSMVELQIPEDGNFQVGKGRGKNVKQFSWALFLKAHKAAGCVSWLAIGIWTVLAAVRKRLTQDTDVRDNFSHKSRLYRIIKGFLVFSVLMLGLETVAYSQGWHFASSLHLPSSMSIENLHLPSSVGIQAFSIRYTWHGFTPGQTI